MLSQGYANFSAHPRQMRLRTKVISDFEARKRFKDAGNDKVISSRFYLKSFLLVRWNEYLHTHDDIV